MKDRIEFYDGDVLVAVLESSMVPSVGSKISVRGATWDVIGVTYALDHADKITERHMRANVDLAAC